MKRGRRAVRNLAPSARPPHSQPIVPQPPLLLRPPLHQRRHLLSPIDLRILVPPQAMLLMPARFQPSLQTLQKKQRLTSSPHPAQRRQCCPSRVHGPFASASCSAGKESSKAVRLSERGGSPRRSRARRPLLSAVYCTGGQLRSGGERRGAYVAPVSLNSSAVSRLCIEVAILCRFLLVGQHLRAKQVNERT